MSSNNINTIHSTDRDDQNLLQRIAQQDKRALEELYFQYHRKLYQFLFRMVSNPGAAEELLNDVMLVVWDSASEYRGQSKISTWIFGIAYRKALKEYEKSRRRPNTTSDEELPELHDAAWHSCPEQWMSNAEFSGRLKSSVDRLSVDHRSVVELTALGHSYKEIGKILNCPENTVKTRMFYARKQMKHTLKQTNTVGNS